MDIKKYIINIYARLFRGTKQARYLLIVPEHYSTIDTLPVLNWHKIKETSDLKWLLKTNGNILLLDLDRAWYRINEEFFNEFGVTDDFAKWWKCETDYHVNMMQSYLKNDRSYRTLAHVAKAEADSLLKDIQKGTFNDSIGVMSKYLGSPVDPSKTSVRTFYSCLQMMADGKNHKPGNNRRAEPV